MTEKKNVNAPKKRAPTQKNRIESLEANMKRFVDAVNGSNQQSRAVMNAVATNLSMVCSIMEAVCEHICKESPEEATKIISALEGKLDSSAVFKNDSAKASMQQFIASLKQDGFPKEDEEGDENKDEDSVPG